MNQAAKGVITSYDALAEMLESIEYFVDRLRQYTETSTPAMDKIVVKLMVGLISVLVLVTQKLKKRTLRESFLADAITYSARRGRSRTGKGVLLGQRHQRGTEGARAAPERRGSGRPS